eukprot:CCRYP_007545-RA/>CCRYP_007545-RA protein AED:0.14 eAED:0.14 QI:299/1/1/1/0.6/0.5/6/1648/753
MSTRTTRCSCKSRGSLLFSLSLLIVASKYLNARSDANVITDDVFTKPTEPTNVPDTQPPSLAFPTMPPDTQPDQTYEPNVDPEASSPTLEPTPAAPAPNPALIRLVGRNSCSIARDIYCVEATQQFIDAMRPKSNAEIEKFVKKTMVDEIGVSYSPLVSANVEYWSDALGENATESVNPGWNGFSFDRGSENFEVTALAMGIIITSVSNIDSVRGTFMATLKLYFYNITETPFPTIRAAVNTIYKSTSKTTVRDCSDGRNCMGQYFRLHEHDLPGAWEARTTGDGEIVRPDGICNASVISTMRPIKADDFVVENVLIIPQLRSRAWFTKVADEEGYLTHVDILPVELKFRPINRKFFPFQIDLLDLFFEMGSSSLIHENQKIVKHMLCLHPSFSGFSNYVFGSDIEGGHSTSDALTMVPYMFFDRIEPWYQDRISQFHYNETRQRLPIGNGNNLQRMLGLRIIVKHPPTKGWFEVLPILFVSLTAIANFVSSDPIQIGATSMVQALLGVNSLVTQNTQLIGQYTVMGQSLLVAYGITGCWIITVVVMMLINSSKEDQATRDKWYVTYQVTMFRYLRLFAASLSFLYIPLLAAYSIDFGNGEQDRVTWVWALVICVIVCLFIVRVSLDCRIMKKSRKDQAEDSLKAMVFSSKPLNLWSQDEVLRWVRIGTMHRETYFSNAKRLSIADKLEAAAVDGEILSKYGAEPEKLVQFVGLPWGDAVKLSEEIKWLVKRTSGSDGGVTEAESALVVFNGA